MDCLLNHIQKEDCNGENNFFFVIMWVPKIDRGHIGLTSCHFPSKEVLFDHVQ